MSGEVCIEAADRFGSAHASNQIFAREKLQSPVDGCGRQSAEVAEPFVNGVRGWMGEIFDEGAVDCEPLRGDANFAGSAQLLEIIAPSVYFCWVSGV